MSDNKESKEKKENAEKPVSLAGAAFEDVLAALLNTPKPEEDKEEEGDKGK